MVASSICRSTGAFFRSRDLAARAGAGCVPDALGVPPGVAAALGALPGARCALGSVFCASTRGTLGAHGGDPSACATDAAVPSDRAVTSNEPERTERSMRAGIIMARRCTAGQKTYRFHARRRRATRADTRMVDARTRAAPRAHRARLERCQLPPVFPRLRRRQNVCRDGCAAGQGGRPSVPEGHPTSAGDRGARSTGALERCRARIAPPGGPGRHALPVAPECRDDPERLYGDALKALADIQVRGQEGARELAPYDREPLARELALMPEWFCKSHLQLSLS